jgi:hypothetical protein
MSDAIDYVDTMLMENGFLTQQYTTTLDRIALQVRREEIATCFVHFDDLKVCVRSAYGGAPVRHDCIYDLHHPDSLEDILQHATELWKSHWSFFKHE